MLLMFNPCRGERERERDRLISAHFRLLDGKCAFRFVFNASSPKPGSLVDTLTCNEPPGIAYSHSVRTVSPT